MYWKSLKCSRQKSLCEGCKLALDSSMQKHCCLPGSDGLIGDVERAASILRLSVVRVRPLLDMVLVRL